MGQGATILTFCRPPCVSGSAPPTISYASPQLWTETTAISTLSPTTTGATSFAVTTGALPTGLSLNTGTGAITGTPTVPGTGSFKVTATGAGGSTESAAVSWTVACFLLQFTPTRYIDLGYSTKWQDSGRTTAVTSDADPLGAVDDLSGNAGHFLQSTAGFRPSYKTSIQNSLPVSRFDGTDDYLTSTFAASQPVHYFVVARYNSAAANTTADGANNEMRLYRSAASMNMFGGAAIGAFTTPESFHLYGCLFNGASSELRIDAASAATGDAGSAAVTVANLGANVAQGVFGNVDIAAFVLFTAAKSGADLTAIEAYLKARWGTP